MHEAFFLCLDKLVKNLVHLLLNLILCVVCLTEVELGLSILYKAQMPYNIPWEDVMILVKILK